MILYHGSSVVVQNPRLLKNQRELDFGRGFYTTSDLEQASKWAKRTANRLHQPNGYVTVYTISDEKLAELKILLFEKPDIRWLQFVSANRQGLFIEQVWDLIIGPVANDQTMPVIDLYLDGMYSEEEAIKRLLPQKLKDQYTFKSKKALNLLQYQEKILL